MLVRSLSVVTIAVVGAFCAPTAAASSALPGPEASLDRLPERTGSLRTAAVATSFGTRFVRYRQMLGGLPVLGSEVVLTDAAGVRGDLLIDRTRQLEGEPAPALLARTIAVRAALRRLGAPRLRAPAEATRAVLPARGEPRTVWQVVLSTRDPRGSFEVLVDARNGDVVRVRDLLRRAFTASGDGTVFDTNPVVAQGSRTGLTDSDDADSAALDAALTNVSLPRLDDVSAPTLCLDGRWAHVTVPDGDAPPAGEVCDAGGDFEVSRSDPTFEAVMAYFHVDRVQAYVQSLGFADVRDGQQRVLANDSDDDNSFYDLGTGEIGLGTGGADDGEDGEVIVHEYGHSIQDDQVPGFGASSEGGAMGEGFGDYLAAAVARTFVPSDSFDPCVAEWDELGFGNPAPIPCLRRVDGDLTAAQVGPGTACDAEVHCAGGAWSGALWDIRAQIGATTADRLVIQSHFSLTPGSDFHDGALALIAADNALYGGVHAGFIRALLLARGLLDDERLDDTVAAARPLALPAVVTGAIDASDDPHDVFAVPLTAGQAVDVRLSGDAEEADLRLLRPGTTDRDDPGAVAAASETTGPNEAIAFVPTASGVHYLDVAAIVGGGAYRLEIQPDRRPDEDSDRDGVGAGDNCPQASNRSQRDWDRDGRGDRCDRSARVRLDVVRLGRRKAVLAAVVRPVHLGRGAVRLDTRRRRCRARCRFVVAKPPTRLRRPSAGRFVFEVGLRRGSYRFRVRLVDRRHVRARSRTLPISAG